MNICFFLPNTPRDGFNPKMGGGSELALYYLSTQLAKMGHQVHVVLGGPKLDQTVEEVSVHSYPIPDNPIMSYISTLNILERVVSTTDLDMLVGFELSVKWSQVTVIDALLRVARSKALTLTYYVGNHYPWLIPKTESDPWLLWRGLRKVSTSADILIAASSIMGRAVARVAGVNLSEVKIVPFGVPIQEYAPKDYGDPQRINRVLFVGRITPHKGLEELIKAAHIAKSMGHHLDYTIVGPRGNLWDDYPGKYYQDLLQLVQRYGLEDAFKFTGSLPREEVVRLMQISKVFAFPSHAEGFGVALIQAMAAGEIPVVYQIEPLTEIIGDAGMYARLGDPKSLAEAILRANVDPNLQKKVEERINNFSIQNVAQRFLDVIKSGEKLHVKKFN
jgi:glycosyltransferase involved in cell wall biosynthesis